MRMPRRRWWLLASVPIFLFWACLRPSHDRDWGVGWLVAPRVVLEEETVRIQGVRHFSYGPGGVVSPRWEDRNYDLGSLSSLWFAVVPFGKAWKGPAHVILSFGFDGGKYLAVSVEARREKGEEYSTLRGMLKRYELMYVLADERDVLQVRVVHGGDEVYLYPIRVEKADLRSLFLDVLSRADALREKPEHYHTLFNSCASNVLRHANAVRLRRIPGWHPRAWLPGYSDKLAQDLGLIDPSFPLGELRRRFLINDRARAAAGKSDFSDRVRRFPIPDSPY